MNNKDITTFEILKCSSLSSKKVDLKLGKYQQFEHLKIPFKEKKMFFYKFFVENGICT
jgi:hypothetical protein